MNPEGDALIQAWEAVVEAHDDDYKRLLAIYEARVEEVCERMGYGRDTIHKAVLQKHKEWRRLQDRKPPTIPPQA